MENPKEFYSKIGRVWCPALNDHIVFNKIGFRHLIWKGDKRRAKADQLRRFALLVQVEEIIKNPHAQAIPTERETIDLGHRHGEKVQLKSQAQFWSMQEQRGDILITVVLRQTERRPKHFLSIY